MDGLLVPLYSMDGAGMIGGAQSSKAADQTGIFKPREQCGNGSFIGVFGISYPLPPVGRTDGRDGSRMDVMEVEWM